MFGFGKKAVELPYEEVGFLYADRVPGLITIMTQTSQEWTGRKCDPEAMGRELAVVSLAIFQLFLTVHIPEEDAGGRVLGGFLARIQEHYANFAFDPATIQIVEGYIRAAGADLRNKDKRESFPTLVPLAISRVTGLDSGDKHWRSAVATIYDFIEVVMKGSIDAVAEAKKRFKLV